MTESFLHATHIVSRLVRAGYIAYFAGGWVRDYIMGHPSEDIDIATNAFPHQIMDLFPNTILVGLAFGVVIVVIEGHQFEVATFRKDLHYIDGRHPEGIDLSATPQEDAYRRDFTINGMFYDPLENVVHDYIHGQEDIKRQIIRTIGNADERFFEDRLRMLRAFRFSSRFSFAIEPETQQAIRANAHKLFPAVAMERVWQEFNKMATYPRFDQAIIDMHRLSLLDEIFPELEKIHLNDLRDLVRSYPHFPPCTPTILYLMELFPSLSLEQKIEISKRIKASNRDLKLVEFLESLRKAISQEKEGKKLDHHQWAYLYAHKDYPLCLEVVAASYPEPEQKALLHEHHEQSNQLKEHVNRIKEGNPLVSATLLQQQGIRPGKNMGALLKEAERLSMNENIHSAEDIIQRLRQTSLWSVS